MLITLLKLHPTAGQEDLALAALPLKRNPEPTVWGMGGPQGQSGLLQKIECALIGIRSPDHQACSESLYPCHEGIQGGVEV
jgi:hypothetical protein